MTKTLTVSTMLNGAPFQATVESRTLLIDLIRDQAGLTGTKRGCNEGKCGACTILLDGMPIKSCNALAARAEGRELSTVEGLARDGAFHPIQQAFHEKHALQCGFCTAGFLMTAKHLLDVGMQPEPDAIREAIHGNICRCTGYQKIVEAIVQVLASTSQQDEGAA